MAIDPSEFRKVLGQLASGVTVVSAAHEGDVQAMTVSAFCSVSLDPPLVLFCGDKRSRTRLSRLLGRVDIGQAAAVGARLFAQRGWVRTVEPERLDGDTLAEAVLDCLAADPGTGEAAGRPDLGGLPVVVEHLRSLLQTPATIPAEARRP